MPKPKNEADFIGPYIGILTILDPKNLDSQVFIIEDVDVVTLPLKIAELGTSFSTVKNTILQKARKINPREVWDSVPHGKLSKHKDRNPSWPIVAILMTASAITAASLTYAVTRGNHVSQPQATGKEEDPRKRDQPKKANYDSLLKKKGGK